jgi:iron-sulfur cluster repair protein YtfE (RIC family)
MKSHISGASPLIQIKAQVQAGHASLRIMLDDLDRQLSRSESSSMEQSVRAGLSDSVWSLFLALDEHLNMEEHDLLPHLREAGGIAAIERIREEHHEQRTVLLAMVDKCEAAPTPTAKIVADVRSLVESLRKDMDREDLEIDRLAAAPFVPTAHV